MQKTQRTHGEKRWDDVDEAAHQLAGCEAALAKQPPGTEEWSFARGEMLTAQVWFDHCARRWAKYKEQA